MTSKRIRPMVEQLEARELLATAIGMNIERVTDYSADWMFTDAFKASRPWLPSIYNTVTHSTTADIGGLLPVSLDGRGWPTRLNQTTNVQGQLLQQMLSTSMYDCGSGTRTGQRAMPLDKESCGLVDALFGNFSGDSAHELPV